MALHGNLDTFRVEEILQLIASQRKTGILKLATRDREIVLAFDEGRVISTHEPGSRGVSTLEQSLARLRALGPAQLGRLAELRSLDGSDPQDIILKANFFQPENLAAFLEEHLQDLLLEALGWRSGSYEFLNRQHSPAEGNFRVAFRTEGVLMEGMRRLDEMARWRRVLTSPEVRLTRKDSSLAHEFEPERRRVLEALIMPRTLAELGESLPMWSFQLYETLFALWEAGLVEVQGARQVKAAEEMRRRIARTPVEQVAFGAGVVVAMAALAVVCNLLLARIVAPVPAQSLSIWEETQAAQFHDDVRLTAERYRAAHGAYPARLTSVGGWKKLPPGALDPSVPSQLTRILTDPTR